MFLKNNAVLVNLVSIFLIGTYGCGNDPVPQKSNTLDEKVEVNWTWKRTVNKTTNVVYGTVKNKTDQNIKQVALEFHTQNASGETVQTHIFNIDNLEPNGQKPFTQDYPAKSTQEDSGFVTVKKVIPAN